MQIDNLIINASLIDILDRLKTEMNNGLLKDIKDSGDNVMVTCIYHKNGQERRPSAGIHKDTGVYHCFTCNTTKTFPEFISNCLGYNDGGVKGTNWLIQNYASVSIEDRKDIKLDVSRSNGSNNSINDVVYVSEQTLDSYRYYHPYMYQRKLNNAIIEMFDIGYDKETDCITFPVRDKKGNCLFVARRSVKSKYFNYPSGVHKPIYGYYELLQLKTFPNEVIICESMLDALVAWVWGKYAVALNGLGSSEQYKELSMMPCRKFILATDNDVAGMHAREILRNNIQHHLITEYLLPIDKKDLNDLTQEEFNNLEEVF